jgi:hypothetical protein
VAQTGQLCCKSRRHLIQSPKMGNIRIRRGEFLNQNSLFGLDLEKVFFAPGPKIVLQHYRPIPEVCSMLGWREFSATKAARSAGPSHVNDK